MARPHNWISKAARTSSKPIVSVIHASKHPVREAAQSVFAIPSLKSVWRVWKTRIVVGRSVTPSPIRVCNVTRTLNALVVNAPKSWFVFNVQVTWIAERKVPATLKPTPVKVNAVTIKPAMTATSARLIRVQTALASTRMPTMETPATMAISAR